MGKDTSEEYIDEYALSQAFLEYIGRQLSEAGYCPTNTAIAEQIGVDASMISQVCNSKRALAYRTIAQYASRIGKNVGDLFLEITQLAGEAKDVPLTETTVPESPELLDKVVDKCKYLRDLIRKVPLSKHLVAEQLYRRVVAETYGLLKDCKLPIVAVVIGAQRDKHWELFVCNRVSNGKLEPVKVPRPIPSNLVKILERCRQDNDSKETDPSSVVIYPGEGRVKGEDKEKKEQIAFWKELTNLSSGPQGRKLRVVTEPVFDTVGNSGKRCSLTLLFLFEYRFLPPEDVRSAIRQMAWPVLEIQARELYVQLQRATASKISHEPLHPLVDRELCQSAFQEAMQDFCELLWVTYSAPWISKVEALNFDYDKGDGPLLFERHYESYMQAREKSETQKANKGAKECYEISPEDIKRNLAIDVLSTVKAVVFNPVVFEGQLCSTKSNKGKKMVIGLPFIGHNEHRNCGVLYLWYNTDYSAKVAEIISSFANKFHKLEIPYPADLKVWLLSSQKQPQRTSHEAVVLRIEDDTIRSRIWKCFDRTAQGNVPRVIQELYHGQKDKERKGSC